MTWRLIPFAEQRVMPWANGGGSTREVAIDPPGASVAAGFRWRVSRAQVASDGPFSVLPGVDRSLWLVSGAGMRLDVGGREVVLDQPLQRCDFAGETPIAAKLLGGPCEDVNVMAARGVVRASAAVVTLVAKEPLEVAAAGQWLAVVLAGRLAVRRGAVVAGPGDALRNDQPAAAPVAVGPCTLLVCTFTAVAPAAS
ncbi:MAG: HutD family protein [Planctomycetota bacterium]